MSTKDAQILQDLSFCHNQRTCVGKSAEDIKKAGLPTRFVPFDILAHNRSRQFLSLLTSAPSAIHGIMARSFLPVSSIGCAAIFARWALKLVWLTRFSSIQSRVKRPVWMSASASFMRALVSAVITRGPVTY